MVKYLRFHNSSFALRYFLMQMARSQCDKPLVYLFIYLFGKYPRFWFMDFKNFDRTFSPGPDPIFHISRPPPPNSFLVLFWKNLRQVWIQIEIQFYLITLNPKLKIL
jgi:hypothetical protein